MSLDGKLVLITGAARRVGRALALEISRAGGDVAVHYGRSQDEALSLCEEIKAMGRKAYPVQADLSDAGQVQALVSIVSERGPLFGLVNSAAIFERHSWQDTSLDDWNRHLMVNLTAPFLLSQSFARHLPSGTTGRIVNMLDWRGLRPGADHLPYTISKAALSALTHSLAVALAPNISVNGLALGAVLPPSDGNLSANILKNVPAARWAELTEVGQALVFLLDGPSYITGEIIHVDGGRHLV